VNHPRRNQDDVIRVVLLVNPSAARSHRIPPSRHPLWAPSPPDLPSPTASFSLPGSLFPLPSLDRRAGNVTPLARDGPGRHERRFALATSALREGSTGDPVLLRRGVDVLDLWAFTCTRNARMR
jgi:hypothetical protein